MNKEGRIAGLVVLVLLLVGAILLWAGIYFWVATLAGNLVGLKIAVSLVAIAIVILLVVALFQRIKEIKGGTEDDLSQY